ncbi:MBL fold metallo-hydrolase [Cryobacterium sp. 1639]|uniref:MBL fold metallo-hydrolase n=1 Tax=Cryobacterium inferilacus TaxID=2866629 RepID=UPI001C735C20|nr:MBL fold metallo-hydrolase [Cryobacterium sp. 1639]MBX0300474.1 MBL fold metallo-hydrolase [Cryobacterium sp. 1639]
MTRPSGRSSARLTRRVAPGIHRLEHAYVNCYLIEGSDGITIVDAAFPATWPILQRALLALNRQPSDVKALVLTHAHFDHLGFARRVHEDWGVPVWAHGKEEYIAEHPYRYAHERSRLLYPIRRPSVVPVLATMARAGALNVRGVRGLHLFEPGDVLDVPGKPRVVFSPGHTFGHSALHLEASDAVLTGDALVTFDPYTGAVGPHIVAGAATADSAQALRSLGALEETNATIVLPGHGPAWTTGIASAVSAARAAGPS